MADARKLSDAEITALVNEHCGISPRRFAEITEPFLVADSDDPEELRLVEWGYADKVQFLLEAALHDPRPH
jgi:hypothetical protein